MKRAFTLIELLVVISIIALIASVVLASLNNAREKGRIGGANYFATQADHIAGDEAVGIWDFDEGSGTVVADRSGFGNNGIFTSNGWSSNTPLNTGNSGNFNGTSAYVTMAYSSILKPDTALSMGAWIYPTTLTGGRRIISTTATGGYSLVYNENSACPVSTLCGMVYVAGSYRTVTVPTSALSMNKWQHVFFSYDGTILKLYLDGKEVAKTTGPGGVISYSTANPVCIGAEAGGAACSDGEYFGGMIDDARIFAKALTAFEVQDLYLAGVESHQNLSQN